MKNELTGDESIIKPDRSTWNLLDIVLLPHKYAFYTHTTSIVWRNIYLNSGFFLPPRFSREFASGDVVLMYMMLGKGGKMHNIPDVMSCYRVTGRGVWTSKSKKEQDKINSELNVKLRLSIPLKYRLIIRLQKYRQRYVKLSKLIPGPVNE